MKGGAVGSGGSSGPFAGTAGDRWLDGHERDFFGAKRKTLFAAEEARILRKRVGQTRLRNRVPAGRERKYRSPEDVYFVRTPVDSLVERPGAALAQIVRHKRPRFGRLEFGIPADALPGILIEEHAKLIRCLLPDVHRLRDHEGVKVHAARMVNPRASDDLRIRYLRRALQQERHA